MKLTKSKLKQMIQEELGSVEHRVPTEAERKAVSSKLAAIEKVLAGPVPRNIVGAHKAAIAMLEKIKEIVNAEDARIPHVGVTAELPGGGVVQAKGKH